MADSRLVAKNEINELSDAYLRQLNPLKDKIVTLIASDQAEKLRQEILEKISKLTTKLEKYKTYKLEQIEEFSTEIINFLKQPIQQEITTIKKDIDRLTKHSEGLEATKAHVKEVIAKIVEFRKRLEEPKKILSGEYLDYINGLDTYLSESDSYLQSVLGADYTLDSYSQSAKEINDYCVTTLEQIDSHEEHVQEAKNRASEILQTEKDKEELAAKHQKIRDYIDQFTAMKAELASIQKTLQQNMTYERMLPPETLSELEDTFNVIALSISDLNQHLSSPSPNIQQPVSLDFANTERTLNKLRSSIKSIISNNEKMSDQFNQRQEVLRAMFNAKQKIDNLYAQLSTNKTWGGSYRDELLDKLKKIQNETQQYYMINLDIAKMTATEVAKKEAQEPGQLQQLIKTLKDGLNKKLQLAHIIEIAPLFYQTIDEINKATERLKQILALPLLEFKLKTLIAIRPEVFNYKNYTPSDAKVDAVAAKMRIDDSFSLKLIQSTLEKMQERFNLSRGRCNEKNLAELSGLLFAYQNFLELNNVNTIMSNHYGLNTDDPNYTAKHTNMTEMKVEEVRKAESKIHDHALTAEGKALVNTSPVYLAIYLKVEVRRFFKEHQGINEADRKRLMNLSELADDIHKNDFDGEVLQMKLYDQVKLIQLTTSKEKLVKKINEWLTFFYNYPQELSKKLRTLNDKMKFRLTVDAEYKAGIKMYDEVDQDLQNKHIYQKSLSEELVLLTSKSKAPLEDVAIKNHESKRKSNEDDIAKAQLRKEELGKLPDPRSKLTQEHFLTQDEIMFYLKFSLYKVLDSAELRKKGQAQACLEVLSLVLSGKIVNDVTSSISLLSAARDAIANSDKANAVLLDDLVVQLMDLKELTKNKPPVSSESLSRSSRSSTIVPVSQPQSLANSTERKSTESDHSVVPAERDSTGKHEVDQPVQAMENAGSNSLPTELQPPPPPIFQEKPISPKSSTDLRSGIEKPVLKKTESVLKVPSAPQTPIEKLQASIPIISTENKNEIVSNADNEDAGWGYNPSEPPPGYDKKIASSNLASSNHSNGDKSKQPTDNAATSAPKEPEKALSKVQQMQLKLFGDSAKQNSSSNTTKPGNNGPKKK